MWFILEFSGNDLRDPSTHTIDWNTFVQKQPFYSPKHLLFF